MSFLFDIFVEGLLQGSADFFLHLFNFFIPDKDFSVKQQWVLAVLGVLVSLGMFAAFLLGLIDVLQNHGNSVWGWIGIVFGVAYLSAGIALKSATKRRKK